MCDDYDICPVFRYPIVELDFGGDDDGDDIVVAVVVTCSFFVEKICSWSVCIS